MKHSAKQSPGRKYVIFIFLGDQLYNNFNLGFTIVYSLIKIVKPRWKSVFYRSHLEYRFKVIILFGI